MRDKAVHTVPAPNYSSPSRAVDSDRRASPRAHLAVAVRQRIGREVHLCQAGNISVSGMYLARAYRLLGPEPDRCWLEFCLPGSDILIAVRAEVIWRAQRERYHLMAVSFGLIAPSHRRMIARYAAATSGAGQPR